MAGAIDPERCDHLPARIAANAQMLARGSYVLELGTVRVEQPCFCGAVVRLEVTKGKAGVEEVIELPNRNPV